MDKFMFSQEFILVLIILLGFKGQYRRGKKGHYLGIWKK